jgi:predicted PurR-regulated permease PerM
MQKLLVRPMVKRVLFALFVIVLASGVWQVLSPFLAAIAWAGILAHVSWPLYRALLSTFRGRENIAAFVMSMIMALAVLFPVLWVMSALKWGLTAATGMVANKLASGELFLPTFVLELPFFGQDIAEWFNQVVGDSEQLRTEVRKLLSHADREVINLIGGIGRNFAKMGFALVTLFFAYRGGANFLLQFEQILESILDLRVRGYFDAAGDATKGVVYGIGLSALAQGLAAGLGYWMVGLDMPFMLAAITAFIALIPFAAPLAWGSLGLWLLVTGNSTAGVGLLVWGMLVVSWVDNFIRPIVLTQNVKIPFILAFFGVLGGLSAFGLVGLFLGPVILAVAYAIWQEWLADYPKKISDVNAEV